MITGMMISDLYTQGEGFRGASFASPFCFVWAGVRG